MRSEMRFFAHELASDLRRMHLLENLDDTDLDLACDLVIRTVAFSLTDLLGIAPGRQCADRAHSSRTVRHLQLVFSGANGMAQCRQAPAIDGRSRVRVAWVSKVTNGPVSPAARA